MEGRLLVVVFQGQRTLPREYLLPCHSADYCTLTYTLTWWRDKDTLYSTRGELVMALHHRGHSEEYYFTDNSKCITGLFYILQPPLYYKATSLILLPFACDTAYQSWGSSREPHSSTGKLNSISENKGKLYSAEERSGMFYPLPHNKLKLKKKKKWNAWMNH